VDGETFETEIANAAVHCALMDADAGREVDVE
jgi:hypothetical protein